MSMGKGEVFRPLYAHAQGGFLGGLYAHARGSIAGTWHQPSRGEKLYKSLYEKLGKAVHEK